MIAVLMETNPGRVIHVDEYAHCPNRVAYGFKPDVTPEMLAGEGAAEARLLGNGYTIRFFERTAMGTSSNGRPFAIYTEDR